jgi:hypothetical protein
MKEYQKYEMLNCSINRNGHRFIATEQGNLVPILFVAVRGGVAFACDRAPFHAVVVGRHYVDPEIYANTEPAYEVLFEVTDHGLDLERRHSKLADIGDLYKCNFYADLSGNNEVAAESYRDYKYRHKFDFGSLLEAPYAGNIRLGIEAIKSQISSNVLDIAKGSPAFEQLSRITKADLAELDVAQKYYAVEALRHAVASFKRDSGSGSRITIKLPQYGQQPHGWMA